jgi:hypothetical protein
MNSLVDKLKKISPQWWGAIAGATAAGATVLDSNRLLGGLVAGGAMLAFAVKQSAPCCAECAQSSSGVAQSSLSENRTVTPARMLTASGSMCATDAGCGGLDELN